MKNRDWNSVNIVIQAVLFVVITVGEVACLGLWWTNHISDRTMIGITLFLSFFAIQYSSIQTLVQFKTKKSVES